MRSKSIFLLVIALAFGVVASVAVSQIVLDQKNRGTVATVPVLIVTKEVSASTRVPPESIRLEQWPADRVPLGAISDPKLIENKFTKQRIYPGEPIIEAKLSSKGRDFIVPEGYRTFDIPVKADSGGGGYIGPGDHVDVYGYFDKGPRVKAAKSVKVMENLEVVMIDGNAIVDPDASKQKQSNTIQLLVKDSQYIVLDTAANLGKLRLALRPPTQSSLGQNVTDEGEKFIGWLKESEAPAEAPPAEKTIVESPLVAPSNAEEKPNKHDMVIVSTSKSTLYRFSEGKSMPQKIDMEQQLDSSNNAVNVTLPPQNSGTAPNQNGRTPAPARGAGGSNDQAGTRMDPVNPPGASESNLKWDPSSGNWQAGGFKATYPGNE